MKFHTTATIGELCHVSIGRTPRRNESRYWNGPHPWATVRDLDGQTLTFTRQGITDAALKEVMPKPVEPGTLLFSFKLSIGKVAFAGCKLYHNEAIAALPIRDPTVLDRDFLFHALQIRTHDSNANHAVLGKILNKRKIEEIEIPLPPLNEQRRIAGILNRVARIEHLRSKANRHLREFASALFVKMFGDPVENPMGWQMRSLAELTEEFRYGTSKKCDDIAHGDAIPILRIPNIVNNSINWKDLKFASLEESDFEKLCLKSGDILFVRTNGNTDYIGRCAVFDGKRQTAYASYLIRARLKTNGIVDPQYISNSFVLPSMRQIILKLARTTAGNYNISIGNLGSIKIPIPTQKLQHEFIAIITKKKRSMSITEAAAQASSTLSASLIAVLLEGDA